MAEEADWSRLDDLLDGALEQPRERRRRWIAEACAGDEGLRSRVESLVELAEGVVVADGALVEVAEAVVVADGALVDHQDLLFGLGSYLLSLYGT